MSHVYLKRSDAPESPCPAQPRTGESTLAAAVARARAGDEAAWTHLVARFDRRLRRIARSFRLSASDIDDVVQATWLNLYTHIGTLRDPEALPGWLATTVRRESLRVLQTPVREQLSDDPGLGDSALADGPEVEMLAAERSRALARAIETLPDPHRRVMALLAFDDTASYKDISTTLGISTGCIGAWRARSCARLQRDPELRALCASAQ